MVDSVCTSTYDHKVAKFATDITDHHNLQPFVWDYLGEPVPEGRTILDFAEAEMMGWQ